MTTPEAILRHRKRRQEVIAHGGKAGIDEILLDYIDQLQARNKKLQEKCTELGDTRNWEDQIIAHGMANRCE